MRWDGMGWDKMRWIGMKWDVGQVDAVLWPIMSGMGYDAMRCDAMYICMSRENFKRDYVMYICIIKRKERLMSSGDQTRPLTQVMITNMRERERERDRGEESDHFNTLSRSILNLVDLVSNPFHASSGQ